MRLSFGIESHFPLGRPFIAYRNSLIRLCINQQRQAKKKKTEIKKLEALKQEMESAEKYKKDRRRL